MAEFERQISQRIEKIDAQLGMLLADASADGVQCKKRRENLNSGTLDPPHAVQDASVPCCRMTRIISDPNTPCLLCCGCVGEAAKPEMLFIPPHAVQDASVP